MALPKIAQYPLKQVTLPICKKKVTFRPFLVKEEKILILLRESKDMSAGDLLNAVVGICSSCTFDKVDMHKLPLPDLEFLFIQIRALSKGKISRLAYRCINIPDKIDDVDNAKGEKCNHLVVMDVDLESIQVNNDPLHRKVFDIPGNDMKIHMRYPTIKMDEEIANAYDSSGKISEDEIKTIVMANCVEMVTHAGKVYKDFTLDEFKEFMDSIVSVVFDEIRNDFLNRFPVLEKKIHFKCDKCGHEEDILLQGLQDFF